MTADGTKLYDIETALMRAAYLSEDAASTLQWSQRVAKHPLATDPVRSEAYFYAGKTSLAGKDYPRALEDFAQTARLSQNEQGAEARYRMAEIHYFNAQFDLAEQQCHVANEQNANYPFWVAKSLLLLSDIAVEKNDLFNAKAALEAVIENFQGDSDIVQEARNKLTNILNMEQQQSRILPDTAKSLQFIDDKND
jgi:tetratricopeptide (TPR) repeat protein